MGYPCNLVEGRGEKKGMSSNKILWVILLVGFALVVGLISGVAVDRVFLSGILPLPPSQAVQANGAPDFNLLREAWNIIDQNYVDRSAIKPTDLQYGAISGMVDALGDTGHTRFLTPEMVKAENNFTQGQFEGIGAEVQSKNGQTVIVAPIDGSPAQKAGLKAGDVILKVNGQSMDGLSLSDVVSKILGPAGTQVTLTILDPATNETREITLTRAKITLQNVTWKQIPGTNYADLRIAAFSSNVGKETVQALQQIQQQGLKGVILDLRNNPGGLLQESVTVASQFLNDGNVLEQKDASGKITVQPIEPGGVATNIPMVVLINEGTASAAEIVSGAIQDAQRAQLIGQTTFGTGTVLLPFRLSDGSEILLATEEWLTPKGRVIWHQGVNPDVAVVLDPNTIPITPEALQSMTVDQVKTASDAQFQKALELLSGSALK